MRVFNGKVATEDYLSTHSLTFSTPEMTLRKFALWLGEEIDSPFNKGQFPDSLRTCKTKVWKLVQQTIPLISAIPFSLVVP
jgi:hypothetical protein